MFTPCVHTSIDAYSNLVTWVSLKDVHGAIQSVRLKELRFIRVSPCPGDSKALHLAFELDNPPRTQNAVIHLDDFKKSRGRLQVIHEGIHLLQPQTRLWDLWYFK